MKYILHVKNIYDNSDERPSSLFLSQQIYGIWKPEKKWTPISFKGNLELVIYAHQTGSPNNDFYLRTDDEALFTCFRIMVKKGIIPHDQVVIVFEDDENRKFEFGMDKNGCPDKWPPGFMNLYETLLMMLL